jgi:hypothetical protein
MKISDLTYDGLTVLTQNFLAPFFIDETTGVISVRAENGEIIPLNLNPRPKPESGSLPDSR